MGRMGGVVGQSFLALKLGIQGIVHTALVGHTDFHMGKAGNDTYQRF